MSRDREAVANNVIQGERVPDGWRKTEIKVTPPSSVRTMISRARIYVFPTHRSTDVCLWTRDVEQAAS